MIKREEIIVSKLPFLPAAFAWHVENLSAKLSATETWFPVTKLAVSLTAPFFLLAWFCLSVLVKISGNSDFSTVTGVEKHCCKWILWYLQNEMKTLEVQVLCTLGCYSSLILEQWSCVGSMPVKAFKKNPPICIKLVLCKTPFWLKRSVATMQKCFESSAFSLCM